MRQDPIRRYPTAMLPGRHSATVIRADALASAGTPVAVRAVDRWIREVIGAHHPVLDRPICPLVPAALQRRTVYYAPVSGCRSREDVVAAIEALVEAFRQLSALTAGDPELTTLVAVFVDLQPDDGRRIVIGAHRKLKDRLTQRGLMVGEFSPGYHLPSTRNPAVDVGDSPAPVLALRHMLPSDRRFLEDDPQWMDAWAKRYAPGRDGAVE